MRADVTTAGALSGARTSARARHLCERETANVRNVEFECLLSRSTDVSGGSLTARFRLSKTPPRHKPQNEENGMESIDNASARRAPWNKGKLVGQKAPLKQREIWTTRIRLQLAE